MEAEMGARSFGGSTSIVIKDREYAYGLYGGTR